MNNIINKSITNKEEEWEIMNKKKVKKQAMRRSNIDTEPTLLPDGKDAGTPAARTLIRRIAEHLLHEDAGMRYGDFPLFHAHINGLHGQQHERKHNANDEIPTPDLRKHIRRAERAMRQHGWKQGGLTQNGPPELVHAIHAYVNHYAPNYTAGGDRYVRKEEFELDEAQDYVINSNTSNRTLGQLKRRPDAVGIRARAEIERRAKAKLQPSAAHEIIRKHVMGGKGRPKPDELEQATKVLHPYSVSKTIQQAIAEKKKWENAKKYHAKVKRETQKELSSKHQAQIDAIRDEFKKQLAAQDAVRAAAVKKPKAPRKKKAAPQIELAPSKSLKLTDREADFIASLTKKPSAKRSAKPPRETIKSTKLTKREADFLDRFIPSASRVEPMDEPVVKAVAKKAETEIAQLKPVHPQSQEVVTPRAREEPQIVEPKAPPPPKPEIIQKRPQIVVDTHTGKQYDGRKFYLAQNGHVNMWSDLERDYEHGNEVPETELPDPEIYKTDPRAKRPSAWTLRMNRSRHQNRVGRGKMFQNIRKINE